MSKFYRTTLVIWSDQPPFEMSVEDLARDAESGDSILVTSETEVLTLKEALAHDEVDSIQHFFPDIQEAEDAREEDA